MIFSQNLISILLSKPDKQADMQLSFLGAEPLPKTPDHQKKFVAHQNTDFFILSYALIHIDKKKCKQRQLMYFIRKIDVEDA